MAFASLNAYVDAAIMQASMGIPAGENVIFGQRARVLVLAQNALQVLADKISQDTKRRHLLQKSFTVTLTNGVGSISAAMLSAAIGYGSVRDADTGANSGQGNTLVKVDNYNDLLRYQSPLFGYYNLSNDQIYTKQISTGDLTATLSPLTVFCSYVPLATEIPDELQNDAVDLLAGMIKAEMLPNK